MVNVSFERQNFLHEVFLFLLLLLQLVLYAAQLSLLVLLAAPLFVLFPFTVSFVAAFVACFALGPGSWQLAVWPLFGIRVTGFLFGPGGWFCFRSR